MKKIMKILQINSYPIEPINDFITRGGAYKMHNLYAFDKISQEYTATWVPSEDVYKKSNKNFILKKIGIRNWVQLRYLKEYNNYDLIYIGHDIHLLPLAFFKAIGIIKTPVLYQCHFFYNMQFVSKWYIKLLKRVERYFVFKYFEQVVFANDVTLAMAMKDYNIPEKHHIPVFWGANISFFDEIKNNVQSLIDQEPFYAAMGNANRDYVTLVDSFKNLNVKLKIFAKKPKSITEVPSNVEFIDLSDEGINGMAILRKYYLTARAVLLPIKSVNDVPNGATVLIEALAAGCPIVITDYETNYIDVEKENVGLKVYTNTVDSWKNAINFIENNSNKVLEWKINARKLADDKYNYQNFIKNIINVIDGFRK